MGDIFACRAEGLHNIMKRIAERGKCGMIRQKGAGETYFPILHGLDELHLRGVIGIKTQDAGGKDDGILPEAAGFFGDDAVKFTGIDEIQALRVDEKLLHIDLKAEFTAGEIQDFDFVMPVMFDKYAFSGAAGLIDGAGKGFGAVGADFL